MGYRQPDNRRHLVDVADQSVITIDNGTISHISIPCFYGYGEYFPGRRHRVIHDHFGWPSPNHVDQSCQLPSERYDQIIVFHEIDLIGEGYGSIEVALFEPPLGLSMTGTIDGNYVKLSITSICSSAQEKDVDVKFSVYAIGRSDDTYEPSVQLRDVVTKGILHIVAGPIA